MPKTAPKAIDLFADFAVDETTANSGVWVPYRGDVEFLIARHSNRKYRDVLQNLYKRNKAVIDRGGDAAEDKMKEILVEAMAKGILLDWRGGMTFQGEPLTYSVDNAKKLLELEGFRDWVDGQAKAEEAYKAVKEEEAEKN